MVTKVINIQTEPRDEQYINIRIFKKQKMKK